MKGPFLHSFPHVHLQLTHTNCPTVRSRNTARSTSPGRYLGPSFEYLDLSAIVRPSRTLHESEKTRNIFGIMMIMLYLKWFKYCAWIPSLSILSSTLARVATQIFNTMLLSMLITIGWSCAMYLMLGDQLHQYRSLDLAIIAK